MAGIKPTSSADLDRAVDTLQASKARFAALSVPDRIDMLSKILARSRGVAPRQVEAAWAAKRIDRNTATAGEEWLAGPMLVHRNIRLLIDSLRQIRDRGRPQIPAGAVHTRPDGQVVARVFPTSFFDKLLFQGFTGDIWMEPGVKASDLPSTMATSYAQLGGSGRVCSV